MKEHIKSIIFLLLLFCLSYFISTSYFQIMLVQGNSMLPNYHNWQFTIIDKRQTQTYTSGDVIAFYCPNLDAILVKTKLLLLREIPFTFNMELAC